MKKNHKGIFFLSFSGLVAALLLAGCPDPNKNGDSPAVAGPTPKDTVFSGNKLEIIFDKELKAFDASQITVVTQDDFSIPRTDYELKVSGTKLVITLKTKPIANQKYKVTLKAGAVTAKDGGTTKKKNTVEAIFDPPLAYKGIARNNNKIELSFNKALATKANVSPNPTHITVTRTRNEGASKTLTIDTDYSLSIAGKKLVIKLKFKTPPNIAGVYTVALKANAVKSANGVLSEAVKPDPTIEILNHPPAIVEVVFETGSNTKLVATFDTALANIAADSFTVQSKADAGANDEIYANVSGTTATLDTKAPTKVIITLGTAATDGRMYRVVVAAGGVAATAGGVSNIAKLESDGVAYSAKPALVGTPHIVGKKLFATFNMNIALDPGDVDKVQVWKDAEPGTLVTSTRASVAGNKTLLEVTLPADDSSTADDVYRLKLLAEAVSKEGDTDNKNLELTSPDITILVAPALDTTRDPYMVGRKIYVTFDKAIEYVDTAKVKVKKAGTSGGLDGETAKITTNPAVNPTNNKQLVITVNEDPTTPGNYYRVHLEAGAIGGSNTALTAEITPIDKDIQVAVRPALVGTPHIVGKKLFATFKMNIALLDEDKVEVWKGAKPGIKVYGTSASVGGNKTLLEVTLPVDNRSAAYDVYRLKLLADAVSNEEDTDNKNLELTSPDITILVAPVLDTTRDDPYMVGRKIYVTFDKAIEYVDSNKVKVKKADTSGGLTAAMATKPRAASVINPTNNKQLVITVNEDPTTPGNYYRVHLEAGAIGGSNTALTAEITPIDKDIKVATPPAIVGTPHIVGKKLFATFNMNIALDPGDVDKVQVYKGAKPGTKVTGTRVSVAGNKTLLEVTLPAGDRSAADDVYRLKLLADAVSKEGDTRNKNLELTSPDITILVAPVLDTTRDPYMAGRKIYVTFDKAIEYVDSNKVKVKKAGTSGGLDGETAKTTTSPVVNPTNNKQLVITVNEDPTTPGNYYRVHLEAGAITNRNTALTAEITPIDKDIKVATPPALVVTPHIVGKKLLATFNMNIALDPGDAAKVQVWKGAGARTKVDGTSASVNTTDKTLLEVTLPAGDTSAAGNVYRLKLLADAVSKDGVATNKNAEFTSSNITILAAPVLDTTQDPYMVGRKIYVTFASAIEYVNTDKVKVKKAGTSGGLTGATETKPRAASVINPTNNKQLVITVDEDPPQNNNYYRVHLEAGAITNRNTALTGRITPIDKDIQVTAGPVLTGITPVFESKTQLSVTLPAGMQLVLPANKLNDIKVQKKADGGNFVTEANRAIAIDGDNSNKVNITLKNGTEATPYIPWKVIFPKYSVLKLTESRSANNIEQATAEVTLRLSDIYSWQKVLASGASESGDRWPARYGHTSVVFPATGPGSRIWVMGGYDNTNYFNDVWSSVDGSTWVNESKKLLNILDPDDESQKKYANLTAAVTGNALWPARYDHTSVVFKNKIWVMGGGTKRRHYFSDVWSSADGITWEKTTITGTLWPTRRGHTSVVFKDKIWVMGGYAPTRPRRLNDVWSSADGSNWNEAEKTAQGKRWSGRGAHNAVVAGNKIWVSGGFGKRGYISDVWYSTDGKDWESAQNIAKKVGSHSSVLFKSRIWLLGGEDFVSKYNHVFSLAEGAGNSTAWVPKEHADWSARVASSVVFDDKVWVLGGKTSSKPVNDVWSFGVQN